MYNVSSLKDSSLEFSVWISCQRLQRDQRKDYRREQGKEKEKVTELKDAGKMPSWPSC